MVVVLGAVEVRLRWLPDREARVADLLLGALIAVSFPVWGRWGHEAVLVLAGLAYAVLVTWTNLDAREDRLTRDRSVVFVDFVHRVEHHDRPELR